jgi:hypothetical protein
MDRCVGAAVLLPESDHKDLTIGTDASGVPRGESEADVFVREVDSRCMNEIGRTERAGCMDGTFLRGSRQGNFHLQPTR